MTRTTVVNINKASLTTMGYSDLEQWLQNPNHIYIGRNVRFIKGTTKSKWANPFSLKKYGRQKCMELYTEYIHSQMELLADINELKGKILGCWCKPERCHGDILIKLIEQGKER